MRKNKIGRKKLDLYVVYKVSGLNLDNLVNILKNKGIILHNIKKTDRKTLVVSVNYADAEKFFAITRDLCYNIKRIGERGKWRFALNLARNFGLVVGAMLFAFCSVAFDDVILSVDYYGSGSVYEREIGEFLASKNVVLFSRFSAIDLPVLSDEIMAAHDGVSFAECVKSGNRLKINLVIGTVAEKTLVGDKETLVSPVNGVIEYIKVYRGTAVKNVGDRVAKGEEICGGFATIKQTVVKVGVIATVSIKAEYVYDYVSENDNDETAAEIFAEIAFGEGEIISSTVEKTVETDGKYKYKVKLVYRRLLYG